jgi:hypothetical protein
VKKAIDEKTRHINTAYSSTVRTGGTEGGQ